MGIARSVGAVAAGVVGWSVAWIAGGALLQASGLVGPGERVDDAGVLWGLIVFSVALSLAAGALATALAAKPRALSHALALGVVLAALGLYFEISGWALAPVWYHVVFLALLIPACILGGRLVGSAGLARA